MNSRNVFLTLVAYLLVVFSAIAQDAPGRGQEQPTTQSSGQQIVAR